MFFPVGDEWTLPYYRRFFVSVAKTNLQVQWNWHLNLCILLTHNWHIVKYIAPYYFSISLLHLSHAPWWTWDLDPGRGDFLSVFSVERRDEDCRCHDFNSRLSDKITLDGGCHISKYIVQKYRNWRFNMCYNMLLTVLGPYYQRLYFILNS